MNRYRLTLPFAAVACLTAAGVVAQATWQEELSYEIDLVYDCEVAFLSHVVERGVGDKQMILAKVHCTDSRAFDAQRLDPYEPFIFTECEDRAKSSC